MLLRGRLDLAEFGKLLKHILHHSATLFHVRHLAAAENHGDLHFVLVLEKANRLLDLETDVMLPVLGRSRISLVFVWCVFWLDFFFFSYLYLP